MAAERVLTEDQPDEGFAVTTEAVVVDGADVTEVDPRFLYRAVGVAALDANPGGEAWYTILTPSYLSFFRIQFTWWGTFLLNLFLNFLELIRLAPKGSGKVREMLRQAQLGLVVGGQTGLFTPMYFVCARKPL